jgi:hypothetical protein
MAADEILTIREVLAPLRIEHKKAYAMAQSGEPPGFKVRGQRRTRRTNLDEWSCERVEQAQAQAESDEEDER